MNDPILKETVYIPESQLLNPRELLASMIRDVRACRFLAWRLFIRNITSQHRQTVLGYMWLLLPPLVQTTIWVFLNSQKVITISETDIPYPAFVLAGTLLWQCFTDALLSPLQQVQASKQMLTKIHFPHEAILLSTLGLVLVNCVVRVGLLFAVLPFFDVHLTSSVLLAPCGILGLMGFGMMIGLLLLPLSLLYEDVQRLLGMSVSVLFFATPVIYPVPTSGWASVVTGWNPVTPLLVTSRQLLTGGSLTHLHAFIVVLTATLILSLVGWIVYRLAMPHLIERIGT